jgi:nicotinamidase-related amidase
MPAPLDNLLSPLDAGQLAPMIAPDRSALLIVDVQEDFASPTGAMGRIGLDLTAVDAAIDQIDALAHAARLGGVPVVFARVITRPETDTMALRLFIQRSGHDPDRAMAICRAGTPGAGYYRVAPKAGDLEIEKHLFSSFVGTRFDDMLRERNIDTLVVAGITTDCCVDCTVRDAFHRNYNVFVVADACAAYDEATHHGALNGLAKNCALVVDTARVTAAWRAVERRMLAS